MKTFFFSLLIFPWITLKLNAQVKADDIKGGWLTAPKDGHIEIYKEGDHYFGKITGGNRPNAKDDKNPDASLRSRPLIGIVILKNFFFNGKEKWEGGTIYDPNNGKTYSCIIKLRDKNTLEVRGFVGISLLGRTEVWTRM